MSGLADLLRGGIEALGYIGQAILANTVCLVILIICWFVSGIKS